MRKKNQIKTIHSSFAIENNSLNIEQITAIIEGKRALGNSNEIQEVKNALQACNLLLSLNPYEKKDLLEQNGKYRNDGVGVFDGNQVAHIAPPANRVPALTTELFERLKTSEYHILIKGYVFHYEFEFIHSFEDRNGREGRLWQSK